MTKLKSYLLLTKPGIIFGNAVTCAGGSALASKGHMNFALFFLTLFGLACVVASGCVFNNYIDRNHDAKMTRTKKRALATGIVSPMHALFFAAILVLVGTLVLARYVNILTVMLALVGFIVYLFFYSFLKYRSAHATLIGSIAGAIPPLIGYCAINNRLDLGAVVLFLMIALWQMPHFYAIATYRFEEYAAAAIPVFPIVKGMKATKIHMLLYILGFIAVSFLLHVFDYVDSLYLVVASLLGAIWMWLGIKGFKCKNDKKWARQMFMCSLVVIIGICAVIPFSVIN